MDWNNGYTSSIYMTDVDPRTWLDTSRHSIISGSIDRQADGLRESAGLEMSETPAMWVRIWLDADQDGVEHTPLFTGIATSPERKMDGERVNYDIDIYSTLLPCSDRLLPRGFYISEGADIVYEVGKLLRATPAPVIIDTQARPRLKEHMVAGDGDTSLTMIDSLLTTAGLRLRIDGLGRIHITDQVNITTISDMVGLSITEKHNTFSTPNILRVYTDDQVYVARNEEAIQTRGEVWEEEEAKLATGETLEQYSKRRLKELSKVQREISYSRRYHPDIGVGDIVSVNNGNYEITSQSITLGYGCETSESAVEI